MSFIQYLRDKLSAILIGSLFCLIMVLMLLAFRLTPFAVFVLCILYLCTGLTILLYDFFRKYSFYRELFTHLQELDQKYLLVETLGRPDFYEGRLWLSTLYETNKSMCEKINSYRTEMEEFKDYIEMWIHEVKIPLAGLLLMCHNNREAISPKMMAQVRKIDAYMEQILYYVRSEYAENDYLIKEVDLNRIITKTAVKNREDLQENGIELQVHDTEYRVLTDSKWLEFMLHQILSNSISYQSDKRKSCIEIYAEQEKNQVILHVKDNGIGITKADLPNVFKKSFTGSNGRKNAKSTGMGLYIVRRLGDRLGHGVEIDSVEDCYTDVRLKFAENDFYKM